MVTLDDLDSRVKALEDMKAQLNRIEESLKELTPIRKRVNQIYDAMEQQGYQFPKT